MAIESFYFSHDHNSRNDAKLQKVRMVEGKKGMEAVGIYWCIVEMLHEEGGFIMLSECDRIAFELRVEATLVKRLVVNYELFRNDGEKFWSESAIRRIEARKSKSEKASQSALEGWKQRKANATALPSDSDRNAIKERKGKEIKETKEKIDPLRAIVDLLDGDLKKSFLEWIQFRKEKGTKITPSTAKKQIQFLGGRDPAEAIAIIDQSITAGWTGLFELKNNNGHDRTGGKKTLTGTRNNFSGKYGEQM